MAGYDYLNFFPFYLNYARSKSVDMPVVEVLDRLRIPILADRFSLPERYQGIQLFQRALYWRTLESSFRKRITSRSGRQLFDEWQSGIDWRNLITEQNERELLARLQDEKTLYLDYFTPEFDHLAHLDNNRDSLLTWLEELDRMIGRIQVAIERSPLANETVMVLLSDHGMNSKASAFSQGFDLIRFFGGAAGGGHHVVTNRHRLEAFKLRGLNPFVGAVITPSTESSYLQGQHSLYPTAWLDLDGNERASIYLRSNVFNKIHILLKQLQRKDLAPHDRAGIKAVLRHEIEVHRQAWQRIADELDPELTAVVVAMNSERQAIAAIKDKKSVEARRLRARVEDRVQAEKTYRSYRQSLLNLLSLPVEQLQPGRLRIENFVPPRAMGDGNTIHDLQNYVTGFHQGTFTTMNYFTALSDLRVRNNVQDDIGNKPVDLVAIGIAPESLAKTFPEELDEGVWLYRDEQHQALILRQGDLLRYTPIAGLVQESDGRLRFDRVAWAEGFPLQIWEDAELDVPGDREAWLNGWHTEREWLRASHRTRYSNAIVSVAEYFFRRPEPQGDFVDRFEYRRRQNADADFMIVSSDGWNFNIRGFNPGGNHGSFFRESTLSTLLISGADVPQGIVVEEPYDGLSFAPTLLRLIGRPDKALPGPFIEELFQRNSAAQ
jgi:hypothetical protein